MDVIQLQSDESDKANGAREQFVVRKDNAIDNARERNSKRNKQQEK